MKVMETKPIFSYERFIRWVKANNMLEHGGYDVIDAVERWELEYGDRYGLPEEIWQFYDDAMTRENGPLPCLDGDANERLEDLRMLYA